MNPCAVNPYNRWILRGLSSFAVVLLIAGEAVAAGDNVGQVSAFSGAVKIIRNSEAVEVLKGLTIHESDKVETGPGGVVQLKFKDGSSFTIYEKSLIGIDKFKRTAAANSGGLAESAFDVLNGKLKFFVNPKAKVKTNTQFRSKSAIMGIRGTSGVISVSPSGETQLVVLTGLVEVKNPKFPEVSIPVAPNFSTRVEPNVAPQTPKPVTKDILQSLVPPTSAEMGFTEDGPSGGGSAKPNSKSEAKPGEGEKESQNSENQKKSDDKKAEDKKPEEKKPEDKKPEGEKNKGDKKQGTGAIKPIFAPGGEVVNNPTSRSPEVSASAKSSQLDQNKQTSESTKTDANTTPPAAEAQILPLQTPVPLATVNVSRELEKITSAVTTTIEKVDQQVQEKVPTVQATVAPTPRPQKVNVKIGLPSD